MSGFHIHMTSLVSKLVPSFIDNNHLQLFPRDPVKVSMVCGEDTPLANLASRTQETKYTMDMADESDTHDREQLAP